MARFDRPCMTFYYSAIVSIALSCTVFELFDVEYYRELEMWVRDHSRSLQLVPLEILGAVSYSSSIVTMAYLKPFVRYLASKSGVTLKTGLGFVQGHWKWHRLIDRIQFLFTFHSNYGAICIICEI